MKLSDVMGGMGLGIFAQVGLVVAALGFLAVVIGVLRRDNRDAFERASRLPLDGDEASR